MAIDAFGGVIDKFQGLQFTQVWDDHEAKDLPSDKQPLLLCRNAQQPVLALEGLPLRVDSQQGLDLGETPFLRVREGQIQMRVPGGLSIQAGAEHPQALTVLPNGNVGIRDEDPRAALSVEGEIRSGGADGGISFRDRKPGAPDNHRWLWYANNGRAGLEWDGRERLSVGAVEEVGKPRDTVLSIHGHVHLYGGAIFGYTSQDLGVPSEVFKVDYNGDISTNGSCTIGGNAHLRQDLRVSRDLTVDGTINGKKGDLAENYASETELEPGEVVCLNSGTNHITRSEHPNDRLVLGVVSTAPGLLLNASEPDDNQRTYPVALCGRVPCHASAENGPIQPGDLLTTASTPGHAMRAEMIEVNGERIARPGTILGKALGALPRGSGQVEVFVMMH